MDPDFEWALQLHLTRKLWWQQPQRPCQGGDCTGASPALSFWRQLPPMDSQATPSRAKSLTVAKSPLTLRSKAMLSFQNPTHVSATGQLQNFPKEVMPCKGMVCANQNLFMFFQLNLQNNGCLLQSTCKCVGRQRLQNASSNLWICSNWTACPNSENRTQANCGCAPNTPKAQTGRCKVQGQLDLHRGTLPPILKNRRCIPESPCLDQTCRVDITAYFSVYCLVHSAGVSVLPDFPYSSVRGTMAITLPLADLCHFPDSW